VLITQRLQFLLQIQSSTIFPSTLKLFVGLFIVVKMETPNPQQFNNVNQSILGWIIAIANYALSGLLPAFEIIFKGLSIISVLIVIVINLNPLFKTLKEFSRWLSQKF
jgi:hypothetical protein